MAQMHACEGLIAQGQRRLRASEMRADEVSRGSLGEEVEEAYGEQSMEEELSGAEASMVESVAEASFMQSAAEASMVESVVEHEASIVDEAGASAGTSRHSGRSPRDSGVILSDASFASSEAASVASEVSSEVVRSMRT